MKYPIQPIVKDLSGVWIFKVNRIVRMLLDTHPAMDMNTIGSIPFTDDERQQFAQLLGYSLNGYGELPYVDDNAYNRAMALVMALVENDQSGNNTERIALVEKEVESIKEKLQEILNLSYKLG